ncbi:MAG TPA: carboxypeptidase regulatory-like domain-containing protein [Gemmatimonadales bacterium]|nr:carboxypeptidase regulatory-like domain-containing protein [Gemmatimonadales bacterium]
MGQLALAAVAILLSAQEPRSTIAGQVRSATSGEPLAGASVVLPDLGRATATDAAGRYQLRDVPPGPQHVTVRLIGHAPRTLHALVPPDGRLLLDITLRPQAIHLAPVEVRAPLRLPGLEPGTAVAHPDREVSAAALRNHPLLAEPDAFQALVGGEVVMRQESPGGVHIRGGAADHTGFLLDGIPVLSPYHAAGVFSAWDPDALAAVQLAAAEPPLSPPASLSGVINGVTREPGDRLGAQGSVSSTQLRLTLDGRLGRTGPGFLLGARQGFPGVLAPKDEPSYVQGRTGDRIAKLELSAFGGRMRLLGYDADNDLDVAATATGDEPGTPRPPRHRFEWRSRSLGAEWRRAFPAAELRLLAWHASSDADATWVTDPTTSVLDAERRDLGLVLSAGVGPARTGAPGTELGLRFERIRTSYLAGADSAGATPWAVDATTPVITGFAGQVLRLSTRSQATLGVSLASGGGRLRPGGRIGARWWPSDVFSVSATYARTHQFAQSLRHPESVVGTIFPADLYLGADAPGVPVAQSDQGVLAAEFRPSAGLRVGLQAYLRGFEGLLLAAPRASEPFAAGAFATGEGTARGAAVDAAYSTTRLGLMASWGVQDVQYAWSDSSYVPEHGTRHLVTAGATWFPTVTTSIRVGVAGAFGRRTTTATGGVEWESCNLLDEGCEFGGSPEYGDADLGGTTLPGYFRLDLGARQHWHLRLGGRDVQLALFATATNLLGRTNLLTYVRDPDSGRVSPVEMRPLAPLVVGLDWRF